MKKKSSARHDDHAWFCLADSESCRLLCGSVNKQHTCHIDEIEVFTNTLPQQEHIRPMTGAGTTHVVEERERRFAGEIIAWLQKKVRERSIPDLAILAPPRLLGVLRMVPLESLKGHIDELKGDLMPLNTGQLATHPTIRQLLGAT
ncbi:MAG: host attachment protein [Phycisphaerales bacterium]|nr:host attachment protein [Phycisphaerales bacterium]